MLNSVIYVTLVVKHSVAWMNDNPGSYNLPITVQYVSRRRTRIHLLSSYYNYIPYRNMYTTHTQLYMFMGLSAYLPLTNFSYTSWEPAGSCFSCIALTTATTSTNTLTRSTATVTKPAWLTTHFAAVFLETFSPYLGGCEPICQLREERR